MKKKRSSGPRSGWVDKNWVDKETDKSLLLLFGSPSAGAAPSGGGGGGAGGQMLPAERRVRRWLGYGAEGFAGKSTWTGHWPEEDEELLLLLASRLW